MQNNVIKDASIFFGSWNYMAQLDVIAVYHYKQNSQWRVQKMDKNVIFRILTVVKTRNKFLLTCDFLQIIENSLNWLNLQYKKIWKILKLKKWTKSHFSRGRGYGVISSKYALYHFFWTIMMKIRRIRRKNEFYAFLAVCRPKNRKNDIWAMWYLRKSNTDHFRPVFWS